MVVYCASSALQVLSCLRFLIRESKLMPDYNTNDPKGYCGDPTRGAAMGRPTIQNESKEWEGKLTLKRSYLDSGGYDKNGTYFGVGEPVYWCANEEGTIDFMLRGFSRAAARAKVLVIYPSAKVRR